MDLPRSNFPLSSPVPWNNYQPQTQCIPFNGYNLIMGKVVRVRPNIYIFVCDYCYTEHRTIDNFLRHSESHFQSNPDPRFSQATFTHSNQMAPEQVQSAVLNVNVPLPNQHAPYPVELLQPSEQPIEITPNSTSDDYIEEVYEIIDLGYDVEGKYPNAENAVVVPVKNEVKTPKRGQPKTNAQNTTFMCTFCNRTLTRLSSLKRHVNTAHAKIFKKILTQKKAYKCKICGIKLPKKSYTLESAYEHLCTHFKR